MIARERIARESQRAVLDLVLGHAFNAGPFRDTYIRHEHYLR